MARGKVPQPDSQESAPKLSAIKVRQGALGKPVLVVLIASLALATIYLVASFLWARTLNREEPKPAEKITMQAAIPVLREMRNDMNRNRARDFICPAPPTIKKVSHAVQQQSG